MVLGCFVVIGCGADSTDVGPPKQEVVDSLDLAERRSSKGRPDLREIAELRLTPCRAARGGSQIEAAGISCDEVSRTLSHWVPAPVFGRRERGQTGIFRRGPWLCWARLEDRSGPITNVCMDGPQVILYSFA